MAKGQCRFAACVALSVIGIVTVLSIQVLCVPADDQFFGELGSGFQEEADWVKSLKNDKSDDDEIESLSIDDSHTDKDLDKELDVIEFLNRNDMQNELPTTSSTTGVPTTATKAGMPTTSSTTGVPTTATKTGMPTTSSVTGVPTTATKTGMPTTATKTGVPTTSSATGVPTTATKKGVPTTATKTGMPTTSSTTGVPTTSSATGVPKTATKSRVPTTSSVTGVPTTATKTGVPTTATKTGVPTTATKTGVPTTATTTSSVTGVPTTATKTGVPTTATKTGVPTTATKTGVPTTATTTSSVTGVPTTATKTGIPTTATKTGVPTTSSATGVPTTATKKGVPTTATKTGMPTTSSTTGVPTTSSATGVPKTATKSRVPTTSFATGVPTTATKTGMPTTSSTTGVPTTSSATGVPITATKSGVPTTSSATGVPTTSSAKGVPTPSSTTSVPITTTPTSTPSIVTPTVNPIANKSISPFVDYISCDFECGFCSLKQNKMDKFDWMRQSGDTQSYYTGPSFDHTTAKRGYYVFTEASWPRKPNHNAILYTPKMQSDGEQRCIDFYYHMLGSGIGSLVVAAEYDGIQHPIFNESGSGGNKWHRGQGTLNVPLGKNFTILFESIRGRNWMGDTAIDDIRLWKGACPSKTNTPAVLACPIERRMQFCQWMQARNDDGNWRTKKSKNRGYSNKFMHGDVDEAREDPSYYRVGWLPHGKGPRRALSGKQDYFAYFRGDGEETAVLRSKMITSLGTTCMRFFAHMAGRFIGELIVRKVGPGVNKKLLKIEGNQGKRWFEVSVNITGGNDFQIEIAATQGEDATIAIDDIDVSPGHCQKANNSFECDFHEGSCGLMQTNRDDCDWKIVPSNSGKALQWDVNRCHGTYDSDDDDANMYHQRGDEYIALLRKEIHVPRRGGCLTIDFHLGKHDNCVLEVRLVDNSGAGGDRKRSHGKKERIYYRTAKANGGQSQKAYVTVPPPRGGCPLKKIELETILSDDHSYRPCRQVTIDKVAFRPSICGKKKSS